MADRSFIRHFSDEVNALPVHSEHVGNKNDVCRIMMNSEIKKTSELSREIWYIFIRIGY